ncbi:GTP-binding protein [Amycolatopsis magusensis]|uniref:GTP-binding protein n=1 Tax=Amycolatopsis magusensis TaxID=882444 RepID=UPI0037B780F6
MRMLNLGIVAHVDAGKTSLTERLLFEAGAIARLGSVDDGSTRTDGMALERRRGITIRSAVAAFTTGGHEVHLIDTPGHADFVAEVERALGVLDGAILVLSAVEGVQAHTRVLMRTLRALAVPTILFVNKIDRPGAREAELLADIRRLLSPAVIAVNRPSGLGTRSASVTDRPLDADCAELLAERSDAALESYVEGLDPVLLRAELGAQAKRGWVYPVFFGSAITGTGIDALRRGIVEFLPSVDPDAYGKPLDGTVFAVERAGQRFAVARLFAGTLAARDRLTFAGRGRTGSGRATAVLDVDGRQARLPAGGIARIAGVPGLRVGDRLGTTSAAPESPRFRLPTLETVVTPGEGTSAPALFSALDQLADQDPLIDLRGGPDSGSLVVSLYGEVQREVIAARLAEEFGVVADFSPTRVVCVQRLTGTGDAVVRIGDTKPVLLWATVGLRVEPGPADSGIRFALAVERGSLPAAFLTAIEETARATLRERSVVDCLVTLTHSGFSSVFSTAADFRNLTPQVLADALARAGTVRCEPWEHLELDLPEDALSPVLTLLTRFGGIPGVPVVAADSTALDAEVPSARLREIEQALPGLTGGAGVLTARPAGHREAVRRRLR